MTCRQGVPGTAVSGTRGGLTGVMSPSLDRRTVATALRARHTFATTGQRLVGLSWIASTPNTTSEGTLATIQQGDEMSIPASNGPLQVDYRFLGQQAGWESIRAYDHSGLILDRDLQTEVGRRDSRYRISWGGARVKDRYREAIWQGQIKVINGNVRSVSRSCPDDVNPEESHWIDVGGNINFRSSTSGDRDGIILEIDWQSSVGSIEVTGTIQGYVKVGDSPSSSIFLDGRIPATRS